MSVLRNIVMIMGVIAALMVGGVGAASAQTQVEPAAGAQAVVEEDAVDAAAACPARLTAKMCKLYKAMLSKSTSGKYKWDSIGCYRQDSLPYHPEGRACDLVYGKIGKKATGDNLADGNKMKNWLVKNHAKYKLDHVIWQGRIYSARTNWSTSGRPQSCSGVTDCHRDHVHVAVQR
ncbi:hypothetical protein ACQPZF_12675 [Actinosynnema sp. CS-041913]|uniref:hypothetical protein n=1 Tax=Actinosynnema sp. CS-041913 TaxID=3239917 RepID=UPI003D921ED5